MSHFQAVWGCWFVFVALTILEHYNSIKYLLNENASFVLCSQMSMSAKFSSAFVLMGIAEIPLGVSSVAATAALL